MIGAGFAGLAAAESLSRCGHEPTVFEARDRVGGRVHSEVRPNGVVIERGAEFIAPSHSFAIGYAQALGLDLVVRDARYGDRRLVGEETIDAGELQSALLTADALLPVSANEGLTVAEALSRVPAPNSVLDAIGARIQVTAAQAISGLPAAALADFTHAFDGDPGLSVAGGNNRIAIELSQRLPTTVRLGEEVAAISWDGDGATASWASGEEHFDRVVIATTPTAIERIRFSPPLPDSKLDALGRVVMGHAAKLFVSLKKTAPNDGVLSVEKSYWSWTANGADGKPALMAHCFAGSSEALKALAVKSGPDAWVADLTEKLRPELHYDLEAAPILVNWDEDPWTGGAYSAGSFAGSEEGHDALSAPVGPIAFAGEHTAGANHALMEGALASGVRAATALDPAATALIG